MTRYSVIILFVVKDIDGKVAWNNEITSHITYRYRYMYLHWNPNVCHGNKLLKNIVALMVIITHSVIVLLLFRSSLSKSRWYGCKMMKWYHIMVWNYVNFTDTHHCKRHKNNWPVKLYIGGKIIKRQICNDGSQGIYFNPLPRKWVFYFHLWMWRNYFLLVRCSAVMIQRSSCMGTLTFTFFWILNQVPNGPNH